MSKNVLTILLLALIILGGPTNLLMHGGTDRNTLSIDYYQYWGSFRIIYSGKPLVPVLLGLVSPKGFEINMKYKLLVGPLENSMSAPVTVSLINTSITKIAGIPSITVKAQLVHLHENITTKNRIMIPLILQLTNITGNVQIKLASKPFIWPKWVTKPNATVIAYYKNTYCLETRYSYTYRHGKVVERFIYASYSDILTGTPLYEYFMYYQKDNENNTNLLVESEVEIATDNPSFGAHYSTGILIEHRKPEIIGRIAFISSTPINVSLQYQDKQIKVYLAGSSASPIRIVVEAENISGPAPIKPSYGLAIICKNGTIVSPVYEEKIFSSNYYVLVSKPIPMREVEHIFIQTPSSDIKIKLVKNLDITFIVHKKTRPTMAFQIIIINIALVVAIVLMAYLITLLIEKI